MNAITDVSAYFDVALELPGTLPEFTGTEADALRVWRALDAKATWVHWRKAAIAASLERAHGTRTDCGAAPTAIQQFCRDAHIGVGHFSRLAKTHRSASEHLATGTKKSLPGLLANDRLKFKHFLVAFNYCVLPVEALIEARDNGLSANTMFRMEVQRSNRGVKKQLRLLAEAADHRNDDDDPESTGQVPTRDEAQAKLSMRTARLPMPAAQHRTFMAQLQALRAATGAASDSDVAAMAVARAFDAFTQPAGEATV